MYSRLLTICVATMLIASCATTGSARIEVVDTACDWVKPIYGTAHDWDVLDKQTKRDILAHNKTWQANCHKKQAMSL
ncbi:Uncharacterised protein [Citrobacter koseri]|uniref:Lipoprotein n=1 Tax=Citrobacter koseri TaxID=545 RepID=A0A2X2WL33_CITKO|nr:Uncharacterised protein [Citrobacter koseri]